MAREGEKAGLVGVGVESSRIESSGAAGCRNRKS